MITNLNAEALAGKTEDLFVLYAGRSGGTTIKGSTAASENLTLQSTGHGTRGSIISADGHQFNKLAFFDAEVDNGNSGAADTIDWTAGNKQKSTLTANVTYTFTAPTGPCNLIFKLVQNATGGFGATWPAPVTWLGTEPTWTDGGANKTIIVAMYYDGTTYWGQGTPWET
jgi:hypothetical protein